MYNQKGMISIRIKCFRGQGKGVIFEFRQILAVAGRLSECIKGRIF